MVVVVVVVVVAVLLLLGALLGLSAVARVLLVPRRLRLQKQQQLLQQEQQEQQDEQQEQRDRAVREGTLPLGELRARRVARLEKTLPAATAAAAPPPPAPSSAAGALRPPRARCAPAAPPPPSPAVASAASPTAAAAAADSAVATTHLRVRLPNGSFFELALPETATLRSARERIRAEIEREASQANWGGDAPFSFEIACAGFGADPRGALAPRILPSSALGERLCDLGFVARSAALLTVIPASRVGTLVSSPEPYAGPPRRGDWWRRARFGMFVHWGLYATPSASAEIARTPSCTLAEWIMHDAKMPVARYRTFAREFDPTEYDPAAWVALAADAGCGYIVVTAKHHDGFALWDTQASDFSVVHATPYGRDLLRPLAAACAARGIRFGVYYSQAQDWTHGGACWDGVHWDPAVACGERAMDAYLRTVAVPQVRELLTDIGEVSMLWWDTPCEMTRARAAVLLEAVAASPGADTLLMNDRLGGGHAGDFTTTEQEIPAAPPGGRDFETCMTVNNSWGYTPHDRAWKHPHAIIAMLAETAAKGGNFLLNVGPDHRGRIPPEIERVLRAVGAWLRTNGSAVVGTSGTPLRSLGWGFATLRRTATRSWHLYLLVVRWPGAHGHLAVPGVRGAAPTAAFCLADRDRTPLRTRVVGPSSAASDGGEEESVVIVAGLPARAPDPAVSVVVLVLEGAGLVLELPVVEPLLAAAQDAPAGAGGAGALLLRAVDADVHNPDGTTAFARVEVRDGEHNVGYWTDARSTVRWRFRVASAGFFAAEALVATSARGCQLELVVPAAHPARPRACLAATVPATGSFTHYVRMAFGRLRLPLGIHTLELRPRSNTWVAVNVRSVTLVREPAA